MGLGARAEFKSVYGYPSPPALGFSFKARDAFSRALKRPGAVRNLVALGDLERGNDDSALAVMLRPRLVWNDADNASAGYSATAGGTYFDALPNPFSDGTTGLGYSRSVSGSAGDFESNTNLINANEPFALRFRPYNIEQAYPVQTFRVADGRFQLEIAKGQARLYRLTAAWTQTQENTLHGLLADTTITSVEQATIDTLRETIYEAETTLDLEGDLFGRTHTLIFIPEPGAARVSVLDGQMRFLTALTFTDLDASTTDVELWPDSPLRVRSNGPAMDWQLGRLEHPATGQIRLGRYPVATSGTWVYSTVSTTPTDTTLTMLNTTINEVYDEIVIDFATDNPAVSPLFYMGYAYRQPGDRTRAADSVLLDTATLGSVFQDLTPDLEGLHRRSSWSGTIPDVNGAFSAALALALVGTGKEFRYPSGADLVCNLYINDGTTEVCVLHTGIVRTSGHNNMRRATDNELPTDVLKSDSKISLVMCDQWLILDEHILEDVLPVGDGKVLGVYIRELLQLVGITSGAMANVGLTTGRTLPQARPGETWRVQPSQGTSLGEWLRHILDIHGDGLQLWIDGAGVWNLAQRSSTPTFTITTGNSGQSALDPLDSWEDSSEVHNLYRVEGANGLSAEYPIHRGFMPSGGTGSRHYIGRKKRYPTVRDEGLRTQADCDYAVRSLVKQRARPGNGLKARVWLRQHLGVFPGDFGTVYGRTMELLKFESGSIEFGSSDSSAYKGQATMVLNEVESVL